jgi:adenylate cyclase, class 2
VLGFASPGGVRIRRGSVGANQGPPGALEPKVNTASGYKAAMTRSPRRTHGASVSAPPNGRRFSTSKHLVELKVRVGDLTGLAARLREEGAELCSTLHQRDVYFPARSGRLKLRSQSRCEDQLVQYSRADLASTKDSRIELASLPRGHGIERVLRTALGVDVVVSKTRRVYEWQGTRVHLDRVDGLGSFLEFEHPVRSAAEASRAHRNLRAKLARLGISPAALERGSYSDLLRRRWPTSPDEPPTLERRGPRRRA